MTFTPVNGLVEALYSTKHKKACFVVFSNTLNG
jgi:hypothetical protein